MSLGLPVHLVPFHARRAFARAGHVVALVSLLVAEVTLLAVQAQLPDRILWPALIPIALMIVVLWRLDRSGTVYAHIAYLVMGTACVFWTCLVVMSQFPGMPSSDSFVLAIVKLAMVMVGSSGTRVASSIGWSLAGLLLAGGATFVAARQTGSVFVLDATPIAAFLMLAGLHAGLYFMRARAPSAQPSLHRAARDEALSAERYRIEAKAAAIMHDTILNHLAAIANAADGELRAELRTQVYRDLEVLLGEEWLLDEDPLAGENGSAQWRHSRLFRAVEEARQLGLRIEVSGDTAVVGRLSRERGLALAQATKQCLVNVFHHAGTDSAEVVVYGTDDEVSVMIVDAGDGFSESDTGSDRLGISHSVRRRIENVGGSVQIWSTLGRGTSVMIQVPAAAPSEGTGGYSRVGARE